MSLARACRTGSDPRSMYWRSPYQRVPSVTISLSTYCFGEQCETGHHGQVWTTHRPSPPHPLPWPAGPRRCLRPWSVRLNIPGGPKLQRRLGHLLCPAGTVKCSLPLFPPPPVLLSQCYWKTRFCLKTQHRIDWLVTCIQIQSFAFKSNMTAE